MRCLILFIAFAIGLGTANAATLPNPILNLNDSVATAGSLARKLSDRARDTLNVKDFGADPTGALDSSPAFLACGAALQPLGGVCNASGGRYLLAPGTANLVIPANVTIDCGIRNPDPGFNTFVPYLVMDALLLPSATTLQLSSGAGTDGCVIVRSGMTLPAADNSQYAGTAIAAVGGGAHIRRTMALGFNMCFTAGFIDRLVIDGLYGDCNNGAVVHHSFDSARLSHIHFWPYGTVGSNGGNPPASALIRPGVGFLIGGQADDTLVEDVFADGYQTDVLIDGTTYGPTGNIGFGSVWTDDIAGSAVLRSTPSTCLTAIGQYDNVFIQRAWTWSCSYGLAPAGGNPNYRLTIGQLYASSNILDCIAIKGATTLIAQADASSCGRWGLNYSDNSATIDIRQFNLHDLASMSQAAPIGLVSGSTADKVRLHLSYDGSKAAGVYGSSQLGLPTVASNTLIVMPPNADAVTITGTATITTLSGGWGGREMVLVFASTAAIASGGNIALAGGTTFTGAVGSIIKFLWDPSSATWIEEFRKA